MLKSIDTLVHSDSAICFVEEGPAARERYKGFSPETRKSLETTLVQEEAF